MAPRAPGWLPEPLRKYCGGTRRCNCNYNDGIVTTK
jgi:hypothetical protein